MEILILVAGVTIGVAATLALVAFLAPEPIAPVEEEDEVRAAVRDALMTGTGVLTATSGHHLVRLDPRTYAVRVIER